MVLILTTILATALTLYFSYSEYRKGTMSARSFRLIGICESAALIGLLLMLFL